MRFLSIRTHDKSLRKEEMTCSEYLVDFLIKRGVKEKEFLDAIRVKNMNLKVLLSEPLSEEEV